MSSGAHQVLRVCFGYMLLLTVIAVSTPLLLCPPNIWMDSVMETEVSIDGAYPLFCKNAECNAYDVASTGECKHFKNGVWAEYWETCGE